MQRGIFTANLLSRKAVHSTLPAGKAYPQERSFEPPLHLREYADVPALCRAQLKDGEVIALAWVVYRNKEERDRISKAVMEDPQLKESMDPLKMPFDGKRMFWGGFQTIIGLAARRLKRPGQGRIAKCLADYGASLSKGCVAAIKKQ